MRVGVRLRTGLAAAVVATALLAAVSVANAASVSSGGGVLSAAVVGHPCAGQATATAANGGGLTYSAVSVTVPAGCAGDTLSLTVLNGTTVVRSGTATVAGSGATVVSFAPGTFTATSSLTVQATVDGWSLPTTWSFTPPPVWCTVTDGSGAACTATVSLFTGVKPGGTAVAGYYDVVVTTTSTDRVRWEVTFYLDHTFYGTRPTRLGNSTIDPYFDGAANWTTNNVIRQSACSAIPFLSVRGVNSNGSRNNNFRDVRSTRVREFSLVVNRTEAGYSDVIAPGCV